MNTSDKIKQLLQERNDICFKMVEADRLEYTELELELVLIEDEIEQSSGRRIEEVEKQYNLGDN